jgi:lipopolysaccharide biosynthesis glycosyltransferase
MDPIHLLCAADARYGAYAGIMLSSVLCSNPSDIFHLHVFSNGMRRRDRRRIAALADRRGSRCTIYDVAQELAGYSVPTGYHLNRTTYARLLMGDLLPESVQRIIYLDCDVICTAELSALWRLGDAIPVLAGVIDRLGDVWKSRLGLPGDASYVNCGVLLINLKAWRERRLGREILDWIGRNPTRLTLADQDAINVCLLGAITPLPDCWNLQIGPASGPIAAGRLSEAVLLHYTGTPKPWWFRFRGLGAQIFLQHKRGSPWRFKLPIFRLTYRLQKSLSKRIARWRPAIARLGGRPLAPGGSGGLTAE